MWECHKCSKPVYFAERTQSLGYDWHPSCLRCEECDKKLNPGQHAEHKGVPYCHHPCYGALFGPQLFGHGTRHECHTAFGKAENRDGHIKRSHLEAQLKIYNSFYEGKHGELKSREVNGRLVIEGALRIYWGVNTTIHLKEEDDSRMMAVRRRSCLDERSNSNNSIFMRPNEDNNSEWKGSFNNTSFNSGKRKESPESAHVVNGDTLSSLTDELVEKHNQNKSFTANVLDRDEPFTANGDPSVTSENVSPSDQSNNNEHHRTKGSSTAIRRRPGRRMEKKKLKRRCSINGHFYLRETSSFVPPFGSSCSFWVTSKATASDVLNTLIEKYKIEMASSNFALFIVKDTGELRRIKEEESPLIIRVMLGPYEDVSKIFIMDTQKTHEVSHEVAQFLNLSLAECRAILTKYEQEELRNIKAIRKKYELLRLYIERRIGDNHIEFSL